MNNNSPQPDIPLHQCTVNGLPIRYAEMGEGPAVLFVHGWPELWYSWRHQIKALAAAGYRVIAPDMPGYGGTGALESTGDYNIINLAGYLTGLMDALGLDQPAILVGHDWGAAICWNLVQLHPSRFSRLINMSVPLRRHSERPPMDIYRDRFGNRFFYQLYFQEPGVAEAEFDADPAAILSRLYCSPDTFRFAPKVSDKDASAGGWIDRLGAPKAMPDWIGQADLDYYVDEFTRTGFTGGIRYYRNIDRNWELMTPYADQPIEMPVLFIAGDKDNVIGGASRDKLKDIMSPRVPNLSDVVLLSGIGHWVQQEAAEEVNRLILDFLD